MHPLLRGAALLAPPQDSAVLLVRVLDVSSARIGGDAILVTDSGPGRARHVLIDASDRGDAVVALLRRFRVDTLAAVILSHPHADHYGGLPDVLRRFPVRAFAYRGTPPPAPGHPPPPGGPTARATATTPRCWPAGGPRPSSSARPAASPRSPACSRCSRPAAFPRTVPPMPARLPFACRAPAAGPSARSARRCATPGR